MKNTYFFRSFWIILLSTLIFLGLKAILPKRLFPETPRQNSHIVTDSLMLEALGASDSSEDTSDLTETSSDSTGHNIGLTLFFDKLQHLSEDPQEHIRIAYFGDSMTDGDYIVQDLRKLFQDEFGGNGVGFVSITNESAASRGSIKHRFSDNWKTQSYLNIKKPIRPFGVNGHVFFSKDSLNPTWVEYKASSQNHLQELINPVLFYGASSNQKGYIELQLNGDTTKVVRHLPVQDKLNRLVLSERNLKSIKINFVHTDSIPFYGIDSSDKQGIHIDNFSSRGNSGLPLSLFLPSLMQEFDKHLHYDLIILHYGTNVLNYGSLQYGWYEKAMMHTISHLKTCFPNAAFLILSTADKATKYDTEMQTDSAVVPLINAQKRYAEKTQSGFINLYELMGGKGSMIHWVETEPALANKDYTHFNTKGSHKMAQLIYRQLMEAYQQYQKDRKH